MISKNVKKYCYEDLSLIENYDKAITDTTQIWHCHHRVETIMNCSQRELIAKECFFNRPAHELIFLTSAEHRRIHQRGKKFSDKHKQKMRQSHLGKPHPVSDQGMKRRIAAVKAALTKKRIKVRRPFTVVCQYDKNGVLVNEWKNVYKAAEALGVCKSAIQRKIACPHVFRRGKLSEWTFKLETRFKQLDVVHPRENDNVSAC